MKNEMVLDAFDVQELSFGESTEVDAGAIILLNRAWLAGLYAVADGIHDIYKGWTDRCDSMTPKSSDGW
jgi:hypothetical protein